MRFVKTICLLCIALVAACANDSQTKAKKPQHIPNKYINFTDTALAYVQDTVYYQQKHFSGLQFALYPNGDTAFVKSYLNGLEEGYTKKWHPNRQKAEKRLYLAGKKEGLHEAWWPNGKQKFKFLFDNDEFNGTSKEWYESGVIFKEFNYTKGHEDGSIKMWYESGKIKANYIIKNGRRYGLLGTKSCINVADSIFFKP